MAGTVYRSVKLVLQNSTNELMTVQGAANLMGGWDPKNAPAQGQAVAEQSSAEWVSQSTEVGFGVSGFIRLGSPSGYLMVFWKQPWSGAFVVDVEYDSSNDASEVIDDSHPDHVIVLVVVSEGATQDGPRQRKVPAEAVS